MKKLIILLTLVMVLLVSNVMGALSDELISCYSMDDADISGDVLTDATGNFPANNKGTISATGVFNEARDFEDTEADLIRTHYNMKADTNKTVSMLVLTNPESLAVGNAENVIWQDVQAASGNGELGFRYETGKPELWISDGISNIPDSGGPVVGINAWTLSGFTYNNGNVTFFINGTNVTTSNLNVDVSSSHVCNHTIGGYLNPGANCVDATGGRGYDGLIDELAIWNRTLTKAEVTTVYNKGSFMSCNDILTFTENDVTSPSITFISENNTLTNLNPSFILLNATDDKPTNNITCEVRNSTTLFNVSTQLSGTIHNISFHPEGVSVDQTFNLNITCFDNTVPNNNSVEKIYTVVTDQVNPFDNLLTIIPIGTEIIADVNWTITASNTNLFGHNVTVLYSNGSQVFSQEVLNISLPDHSITIPVDVSAYGTGIFTVITNESDDHTKNKIKKYNTKHSILNKQLEFDTGKANIKVKINKAERIKNGKRTNIKNKLKSLGHIKKEDRYEFNMDFDDNNIGDYYEYEYVIEADKKIFYRKDSGYKGHFVIIDGNDGNWLDFEGENNVQVSQDTSGNYIVKVTSLTDAPMFKSIGGVNVAGSTTTFDIIAPTIDSFECEESDTYADCSTLIETESLTATRLTCFNGTNVNMTFAFGNGTIIFENQITLKSNNIFVYNNSDVTLINQEYNLSGVCSNDASSVESYTLFTPLLFTTPPTEGEVAGSFISAVAVSLGGVALVIIIIIVTIKGLKKTTRGKRK